MSVYGKAGLTALITVGIGLLLHFFMPLDDKKFIKLIIDGVVVVVVYLACTFTITFNKQERRHYMNILFEILHIKKRFDENA